MMPRITNSLNEELSHRVLDKAVSYLEDMLFFKLGSRFKVDKESMIMKAFSLTIVIMATTCASYFAPEMLIILTLANKF